MTPELEAEIRSLYRPGAFGYRQVAARTGVSRTTVKRVIHPERAERDRQLSREAKRRRTGVCVRCGRETRYNGKRGNNGPSEICTSCAREDALASRRWTREAIIEAMQRWALENGRPPTAYDWKHKGEYWPNVGNVFRAKGAENNAFASWADAIEAAGFERPEIGGRYKERPWTQLHDRARIMELLDQGLSQAEVAREVGCSAQLVSALKKNGGTLAQVRS